MKSNMIENPYFDLDLDYDMNNYFDNRNGITD